MSVCVPSLRSSRCDRRNDWIAPRIQVLAIRHPKHSDDAPIAFLVVERDERYETSLIDGVDTVINASITLSYRLISSDSHPQRRREIPFPRIIA